MVSMSGLAEALSKIAVSKRDYACNDSRANWAYHCFNRVNAKYCLDLGSGFGTITFPLSRFYDNAVSVDLDLHRLRFQILRNKAESGSLLIIRGDANTPVFPPDSFDLIVANGLLEWIPLAESSTKPEDVQLEFLAQIRRMLRPGGCLYIGSENRFSILYLRGITDHGGLPFTSILPRRISNCLTRYVLGVPYRTYTYSADGYQRLLKRAGFTTTDIYWVMPHYNIPSYSGILKDARGFMTFLRTVKHNERKAFYRFLIKVCAAMPIPLLGLMLRAFCPSFLIFAWKTEKRALESQFLEETKARSFVRCNMDRSGRVTYLVLKDDGSRAAVDFQGLSDFAEQVESKDTPKRSETSSVLR